MQLLEQHNNGHPLHCTLYHIPHEGGPTKHILGTLTSAIDVPEEGEKYGRKA